MTAVAIWIIFAVLISCVGILVYLFLKGISSERPQISVRKPVGEFDDQIRAELGKLPISRKSFSQTSKMLSKLVEEEIQKQSNMFEHYLSRKYEGEIEKRDSRIREAEAKYESAAADLNKVSKGKRQTESVVRSIAEGSIIVNEKGETLMMNPAAESVVGLKKEELIGKPIAAAQREKQVISFIHKLTDSEEEAVMLLGPNGTAKKLIRQSSAVIETESGQTKGFVSILPEVTEDRQVNDLKTEFMANISHEFRAPLVCIQKSLEGILQEHPRDLNAAELNYIDIAKRNTKRLESMVNDILDFAKLDAKTLTLRPAQFKLCALITDTIKTFEVWAREKGISIESRFQDRDLVVDADPTRMGQILTNLIANGIKFTPRGGKITVECRLIKPKVPLKNPESNQVEIKVRDTGIGISIEDQKKIFEKFTHAGTASLESEGGVGLGLAIVRELTRLHGGKVFVESVPEKGSCFTVQVPQFRI